MYSMRTASGYTIEGCYVTCFISSIQHKYKSLQHVYVCIYSILLVDNFIFFVIVTSVLNVPIVIHPSDVDTSSVHSLVLDRDLISFE